MTSHLVDDISVNRLLLIKAGRKIFHICETNLKVIENVQ